MSRPPAPTRPGPWLTMWHNFWDSFSRVRKRKFVGEDSAGNRFYEYVEGSQRGNVERGFEPLAGVDESQQPSVEWRSWLNKSRRFPPSEEEIQLNMLKQQAQLAQNEVTEKLAPKVESTGVGAADTDKRKNLMVKEYPKYSDEFENIPGAKKKDELDREEKKGKWEHKKFFFEK